MGYMTAIPSYPRLAQTINGYPPGTNGFTERANKTDARTYFATLGAGTVNLQVTFDANGQCNGYSHGMTGAAWNALTPAAQQEVLGALATMGAPVTGVCVMP